MGFTPESGQLLLDLGVEWRIGRNAAGHLVRVPRVEWNFARVEEEQLFLCSMLNGLLAIRE